ncbi:MAG: hypothetical protein U0792_18340 [Gemmataceae bacterium]
MLGSGSTQGEGGRSSLKRFHGGPADATQVSGLKPLQDWFAATKAPAAAGCSTFRFRSDIYPQLAGHLGEAGILNN